MTEIKQLKSRNSAEILAIFPRIANGKLKIPLSGQAEVLAVVPKLIVLVRASNLTSVRRTLASAGGWVIPERRATRIERLNQSPPAFPVDHQGPSMTRPRRWMLIGVVVGAVGVLGVITAWWLDDTPPPPARFEVTVGPGEHVLGFSPDSRWFVVQDSAGRSLAEDPVGRILWDVTNGRSTRRAPEPTIWWRSFTRDHQRFAAWNFHDQAVVWGDTATEEIQGRFLLKLAPKTVILDLCWIENSQWIQLTHRDLNDTSGLIEVFRWDVQSGEEIKRTVHGPGASYHHPIAYSPDGQIWAYVAPKFDSLQFWNPGTDQPIGAAVPIASPQPGSKSHQSRLGTFTHDGRTLLIGSDDGKVNLWDVASHQHIRTIAVFPRDHDVFDQQLSLDDGTLAISGQPIPSGTWLARFWKRVRVWATGQPTPSQQVSIQTLVLIDLTTGRRLATYPARGIIDFSDDGRFFATHDLKNRFWIHDVPRAVRP